MTTQTADKTSSTAPPPHKALSGSHWGIALFVTLCFAFGNWGLEYTPIGEWLQFETFSALNSLLPPFAPEPLPVIVVDISELRYDSINGTDRDALKLLVKEIASQRPYAIGIDIDFSPQNGKPPLRKDEKFFEYCDGISKNDHVPIFLGIHRTLYSAPEYWLGFPDYNHLAVGIGLHSKDTRQMVRWIANPTDKQHRYLRSMAEALSEEYLKARSLPHPSPHLPTFLMETTLTAPREAGGQVVAGANEEISVPQVGEFHYGQSPVNYSKLEELTRETISVNVGEKGPSISGRFNDKVVILGDTHVEDMFTIPGPVQPVRGIYLHASTVYTFARQPLCEFRVLVRFLMDVLLSIGLVVQLSYLKASSATERHKERVRRHGATLILVLLAGWALVRFAGVLWLDFIPITVSLLLHPWVERKVHHRWTGWYSRRSESVHSD